MTEERENEHPPLAETPRPTQGDEDAARATALAVAAAGLDKKALNVEIIDVRGKVDYADYVVVMSGRSSRGAFQKKITFANLDEIEYALKDGIVTLHTKIKCRFTEMHDGELKTRIIDTTPGRMKIANLLPQHDNIRYELVDKLLTKKDVGQVIDVVYRHCGQKATVIFCDRLMALGFGEAAKAGVSFGKDDIIIPEKKTQLVEDTHKLVSEYEQQYADGLITKGEKYNKVVDAWAKCTDRVSDAMMAEISKREINDETGREKNLNAIYMCAHSGARGSQAQMKQLGGMRGLMAKPSGEIIETPIISNFKEGLTVLEYFNSTHGARKGLADTALKTANSGYLTRRLVDVAQDCIIVEEDCGTTQSIEIASVIDGGDIIVNLGSRLLGRTLAQDVKHPETGDVLAKADTYVDEPLVDIIENAGIQALQVRSPLTCESEIGVCAACYGRDLARGTRVNIGEAVGVIAAQSIGEPGTQLTMRTFHIGGAAQVTEQSHIESSNDGKVVYLNPVGVKDSKGAFVVMSRSMQVQIQEKDGRIRESHKVPYGAKVAVEDGQEIKRGTRLADWDPFTQPIVSEVGGTVRFEDVVDGISVREEADEATGISNRVVIDWRAHPKGGSLKPAMTVLDKKGEFVKLSSGNEARSHLPVGAILSVADGDEVKPGDILARIPTEGTKTRDITGGLPRVAELFEARKPKDCAVIAEVSGRVEFGKDYKTKRRISIVPEDENLEPAEYMIPKGKHIAVQEGDLIQKGEYLIDGNPDPHDILRVGGVEALANYLINEIQDVYRLQGVPINDKHIEVIVRQMLQKEEVVDAGDTTLLTGDTLDKVELEIENKRTEARGGKPATSAPVLLGITKASLQTRSFISAASFQETTRVLTEAAVNGKVDTLEGLKENVIVGRLIPAGTGGALRKLQRVAFDRDEAEALENAHNADAVPAESLPGAEQPEVVETEDATS